MRFELGSPGRAAVYAQAVQLGLSQDSQAAPALWEEAGHGWELTGRQGCVPCSRLRLVMSSVAELGREP